MFTQPEIFSVYQPPIMKPKIFISNLANQKIMQNITSTLYSERTFRYKGWVAYHEPLNVVHLEKFVLMK